MVWGILSSVFFLIFFFSPAKDIVSREQLLRNLVTSTFLSCRFYALNNQTCALFLGRLKLILSVTDTYWNVDFRYHANYLSCCFNNTDKRTHEIGKLYVWSMSLALSIGSLIYNSTTKWNRFLINSKLSFFIDDGNPHLNALEKGWCSVQHLKKWTNNFAH